MQHKNYKHQLLVDVAAAAALVGFVLIVSPGLAVVGMLALLVLLVASAGLVIELAKARRGPHRGLHEDRRSPGVSARPGRGSRSR